jgi:hypothetical protein
MNASLDPAEKAYESQDVPFRPWAWFALGFAGSLAVIIFGVYLFTRSLATPGTSLGRTTHPADESLSRFPQPQLQTNPSADLINYLQKKESELNTYGWIDRKSGIVRIPIDRAINVWVERGVSVRPPDSGLTELDMQNQKAGVEKIVQPDGGVPSSK